MSIRLIHYTKKKNKKGLSPIYVRIYRDGKESYLSTGHYIHKTQWDKVNEQVRSTHPLADEINTDILHRKREALSAEVKGRIAGKRSAPAQVKEQIQSKDFFSFADLVIESLKNKRAKKTIDNYEKHLRKLEGFLGVRELPFAEMDRELLEQFERWISAKSNRRKDTSNYAFAILKTLRAFCRLAVKRRITDVYPFEHFEMPEETPGDKDHLTLHELDTWTKFYKTCADPVLKEAALYFLFGCYTGLRISDWQKFNLKRNVAKDYITLRATKNKTLIAVPITKRLRYVLNELQPMTLEEPTLNEKFKIIAGRCKINKHLSSHCARRTFAVTICLERGVPSETAATMMGITLATFVKSYSKITPEKIVNDTRKAWKGL